MIEAAPRCLADQDIPLGASQNVSRKHEDEQEILAFGCRLTALQKQAPDPIGQEGAFPKVRLSGRERQLMMTVVRVERRTMPSSGMSVVRSES